MSEIKRLLGQGRLADAELVVSSTAGSSHEFAQGNLIVGVSLLKAGQNSRAIELLERALSADPSLLEAMNWLSVAYRLSGRLDDAESVSLKALSLDASHALSMCNLGLVYLHKQDPGRAVEYLARAVELQPREAQFRHNLGLALQSQGREAEAGQQYRAAVSLSPGAAPSLLALGGLMLKYGNASGALEGARQVLSREPASVSANLLAARALANLGEERQSEAHLRRILASDPTNTTALSMLGFRLQSLGDFEAAESSFRRSIELNPLQGISYWGLRQGSMATESDRAELERLVNLSSRSEIPAGELAYLFFTIAKCFADLREFESAIKFYDQANEVAAEVQLGKNRFDSNRYAKAVTDTQALFTREFIEANLALGCDDERPIFIIGMMRSGTTLMEQILSSHPEVTAGGELRFWLERGPKTVDPSSRRVDPTLAAMLIRDYQRLQARISPQGRVTDKMPENSQVLGLIHILFPRAKVIHMRRHPVDVCLSIYTTPYEISPEFAHVRDNIVFAYREHERLMAHWQSVLPPGAYLDVCYEDLIDAPEVTIRRVLDHCGLPWDERCLSHPDNRRAVNTPSVWQVRQPIYRSSRGKWKQYQPWLGAFSELLGS